MLAQNFTFEVVSTLSGFNLFLSVYGTRRLILSVTKNFHDWLIKIEDLTEYGIDMTKSSWSKDCLVNNHEVVEFKMIIEDTMRLVNTHFNENTWTNGTVGKTISKICKKKALDINDFKNL